MCILHCLALLVTGLFAFNLGCGKALVILFLVQTELAWLTKTYLENTKAISSKDAARLVAALRRYSEARAACLDSQFSTAKNCETVEELESCFQQAVNATHELAQHTHNSARLISAGVVPAILDAFLHTDPSLQWQALAQALMSMLPAILQQIARIMRSGVIATVLRMAHSPHEALQEIAAGFIYEAAANDQARPMLIKGCPMHSIVHLLHVESDLTCQTAAAALVVMAKDTATPGMAAEAGAIPPLVRMLQRGSDGAKANAAFELQNMAISPSQRPQLAEAGAIYPLLHLLGSQSPQVQMAAAGAIVNMAKDEGNQTLLAEAGAVRALMDALQSEDSMVQREATAALKNLSHHPDNLIRVAEAAPALLQRIFHSETAETQELAASAIYNLIRAQVTPMVIAEYGSVRPHRAASFAEEFPGLDRVLKGVGSWM